MSTQYFLLPDEGQIARKADRAVYAAPTFKAVMPTAGTYYVNLAGVLKPSVTNIGLGLQATAALSASVSAASFEEIKAAVDGSVLPDVPWTPAAAVTADAFHLLVDGADHPLWGSVLRLVVTGPCTCYVLTL